MTETTIIGAVREHIKSCPVLDELFYFGVDNLQEEPTSYMIETVPSKPVVKGYIDGSAQKQFVFAFSSRERYGEDALQNLSNLGFYDAFAAWLEECNDQEDLPDLPGDRKSLKYEVMTDAYAYNAKDDKAQYRIQCRLLYFEERK